MKININDKVKVRLTFEGRRILLENDALKNFPVSFAHYIFMDEDGFHHFQLWNLFEFFGPHFWLGADQFFVDNEIIFLDE